MAALLGRERELAAIQNSLASAAEGSGSSLLLRGEPGIGKSALLEVAATAAADAGLHVLRTSGTPTEMTMPFAALQRLVHGLERADALAAPQREALEIAFGMRRGERPEVFLIALAVLDLLSESAARTPVLVAVEDAHWLDDATADVLAFVARRVELEPIAVLLSARDGHAARIDAARLPELFVRGLDPANAERLLDEHAPELSAATRKRVLELAAGNPLALIELPRTRLDVPGPVAELPLSQRLERAFSERLDDLPDATRTALLVAAIDEGGALSGTLAAAARLDGAAGSVAAFAPAEQARLVTLAADAVRFRHPLVPAAVNGTATTADRQAAHSALATAYAADPDRVVWHEAAALAGPNESIAARLVEAAERAEQRGAPAVAAAALERSAGLSPDEGKRGTRLVAAAEAHFAIGRPDVANQLLARAKPLVTTDEERVRLAFMLEATDRVSWSGAPRVEVFERLANELTAAGEGLAALRALHMISMRMWWGDPTQADRDLLAAAAKRAAADPNHPALLDTLAHVDPMRHGPKVLERIRRLAPDPRDPTMTYMLGSAADGVFSADVGYPFIATAVEGFREQGRLGVLAQALVSLAYAAMHLGKADVALTAAEEAARLARDTDQGRWSLVAGLLPAIIAGERGDLDRTETLAAEAEAVLMQMGANPLLSIVQFARGRGAVAHQHYEEGYHHLRRSLEPTDAAYQPFIGAWGLSDLIESALHTERKDEALVYLARLENAAESTHGTLLQAQVAYARPLVAPDDRAEELYQAALEHGLKTWPCYRGRLLLSYGRWLRRQRRVAESRAPLRAARELFDAMGFSGLSESARSELRASGESSHTRSADVRDQLTPQELQIARMAANGLTNREIGSKLYLSHRTVGSHLYRLFPKLGITSRNQLEHALSVAE